jgi:hypothetical protein
MTGSQSFFLLRRWRKLFSSVSLQRLNNTIEIFEPELDALIKEKTPENVNNPWYYNTSKKLLDKAKDASKEGDAELGWLCLKAADRFILYGLEDNERNNEAKLILAEAADEEKGLTSWRRKSIMALLAEPDGKLKPSLAPSTVARAKRTLDEHHDNDYHKYAILKVRLRLLTFISWIAIAIWIAWPPISPDVKSLAASNLPGVSNNPLSPQWLWFAVILSGVLGAVFSGFSSSIATDRKRTRIKSELTTSTLTFARLSLAMVSAIAISIFLLSGVLKIPSPNLELLLAVAFASGFSERLLLRAVDSLSK